MTAAIGLSGPVVMLLDGIGRMPDWMIIVLVAAILTAAGCWVAWRRSPALERAAAAVFALAAVGCIAMSNQSMGFGAAWVAALMLALTFGTGVTVGYAAALVAAAGILHVALGHGVSQIIAEMVITFVFTSFGIAFAIVLRHYERAAAERERLIEERDRTLRELEAANQELGRRLGTEHDLVLAEERTRAARELHDGLGHRLTAIGMAIEFARRTIDRQPERAAEELSVARTLVTDALDAMRRLVRAMHPVDLGSLRDTAAFRAIADAFRSTGLRVEVHSDGDRPLPREHSLLLVRFVQEGLTNAVRHADGSSVEVRVTASPSSVTMRIDTSGRGPAEDAPEGFGIRSLRERAHTLGGRVESGPTPDGFGLQIDLPLRELVGVSG